VIDQITTTATGTLSGAITDADIYADIITLLDEWDLTDDSLYPWRNDLKVSLAPLVSRDEFCTQDFDSTGFYTRDYGAPVTDFDGNTLGDPDWLGDTGYTLNPNPQTGSAKWWSDFAGHNSGTAIDIQIPNPFGHCAVTSRSRSWAAPCPWCQHDHGTGHITGTVGDDGHYGITVEITGACAAATGDILGSPNPAGYQNYFDFAFHRRTAAVASGRKTIPASVNGFGTKSAGVRTCSLTTAIPRRNSR
jgi:hypothetical protein